MGPRRERLPVLLRSRARRAVRSTARWYLEHEDWWTGILSGEYVRYYGEQYGARLP
ncbi:MAG: hypothetical protein HY905_08950 [Deltaproteobacteria bacterium]|nr:hypothetical protein [Deltaproteobacteria bacterium]